MLNTMSARLKEGHRVQITGGKYDGKRGTILKINRVRHQVEVDNVGIGWITHTFCSRITEVQTMPRSSRLSTTRSTKSCLNVTNIMEVSDASTTSLSSSPWPELDMSTQVLLDLLANSIAIMSIDDNNIDEWTQQLQDRIIHFRQGP
jgi:ribosomal protein L24